MLTAQELEAQEVFENALKQAWEAYRKIEVEAKEVRDIAVKKALEDFEATLLIQWVLSAGIEGK